MEKATPGSINVRIPLETDQELLKVCSLLGISKSDFVKFLLREGMDKVANTPQNEHEGLAGRILITSRRMREGRPTSYKKSKNKRIMLVAEDPNNSWMEPKKRGRKKKSDQPPSEKDESSPKE